jgi:hypothetical protein
LAENNADTHLFGEWIWNSVDQPIDLVAHCLGVYTARCGFEILMTTTQSRQEKRVNGVRRHKKWNGKDGVDWMGYNIPLQTRLLCVVTLPPQELVVLERKTSEEILLQEQGRRVTVVVVVVELKRKTGIADLLFEWKLRACSIIHPQGPPFIMRSVCERV